MPAGDQGRPGERRGSQQQVVVADQDRHHPRPVPAHLHYDPAGPADDVAATHVPQVRADQPSPGAQADQPARAHPPRQRRLRVRERQVTRDLRGTVRGLAPFPGQRRIHGSQRRGDPAGQEPQVGPQRPARRTGQPWRADREPLDHRRMKQHPRHRFQATADRVIGELSRRPQQALRPFPAVRRRPGHHRPGEIRSLRRHRRRPPAGDQPASTAPSR